MTAITNGIKVIKEAVVQFAQTVLNVVESAANLLAAAAKGVYNFFRTIFGSTSPYTLAPTKGTCPSCTTPWQWWLMSQDPSKPFFVKVLDDDKMGIGANFIRDYPLSFFESEPLISKPYNAYSNSNRWFVSHGQSLHNFTGN